MFIFRFHPSMLALCLVNIEECWHYVRIYWLVSIFPLHINEGPRTLLSNVSRDENNSFKLFLQLISGRKDLQQVHFWAELFTDETLFSRRKISIIFQGLLLEDTVTSGQQRRFIYVVQSQRNQSFVSKIVYFKQNGVLCQLIRFDVEDFVMILADVPAILSLSL